MAEQGNRRKIRYRYLVYTGLVFLLFIMIGKRMYESKEKTKAADSTTGNKKEIAYPYRVIPALDNETRLIAYELHKSDSADGEYGAVCSKYPRYSAIIKSVNPAKDDYKNNCRSVISDIVKTTGNPTIEINIYDDYQSYTRSEEGDELQNMSLSKSVTDSMLKHIVASYSGYIYGEYEEYGENYVLQFYPQANNHYTAREKYDPNFSALKPVPELNKRPKKKLFNQK